MKINYKYNLTIVLICCSSLLLISEFLFRIWLKIDLLPRTIKALGDIPFNVIASLCTIFPFSLRSKTVLGFSIGWASLLTILIDVDHFIAAGSFSIKDAISFPHRPVTHSFVIVFLFAVILSLITRSTEIGIISFFSLCSHLLRDAPHGSNFIFYPIISTPMNINYFLCLIILIFLPIITLICGLLVNRINLLSFWFTDSEGDNWYKLLTARVARPVEKAVKLLYKIRE